MSPSLYTKTDKVSIAARKCQECGRHENKNEVNTCTPAIQATRETLCHETIGPQGGGERAPPPPSPPPPRASRDLGDAKESASLMSGHAEGSVRSASHALTHTRLTGRPRHDGNTRKGERVSETRVQGKRTATRATGRRGQMSSVRRQYPVRATAVRVSHASCHAPEATSPFDKTYHCVAGYFLRYFLRHFLRYFLRVRP